MLLLDMSVCCLCAAPLVTLADGKLVSVNAAAGSPKLDLAASLDLFGLAASYKFTDKMRTEAVAQLEALEAWVDKQQLGMELAQHLDTLSQSFDSLLKVMDALYQVSMTCSVRNGFSADGQTRKHKPECSG